MSLHQKGLDYILSHKLPKIEVREGELLSTEHLARTFRCSITFVVEHTKAESLDALTSRFCGRPHLPEGMEWPRNTYLVAQINLEEAAALNVWDWFPSAGTAYLFVDTSRLDSSPYSSTAVRAIVMNNEAPRTLREVPPDEDLPDKGRHYKQDYLKWTYGITMKPVFSIGFADDLPKDFLHGLEAELGIPMGDPKESAIGGEPKTWQDEEAPDLFLPQGEFYDYESEDPVGDRFLLFQDSFAEGTAHFWVQREALVSGAFEQIDMTFSGA